MLFFSSTMNCQLQRLNYSKNLSNGSALSNNETLQEPETVNLKTLSKKRYRFKLRLN